MKYVYHNDTELAKAFFPLVARLEEDLMRRFRNRYEVYVELLKKHIAKVEAAGQKYYSDRPDREFDKDVRFYNVELGRRYSFAGKDAPYGAVRDQFNEEFAAKDAAQMAADSFNSFIAKFEKKVGDIKNVEIQYLSGADCVIRGEVNGKQIQIDQQTVSKVSVNGNFFYQFPARIYVDGKFVPEKKFKEVVGA